MMRKSRVSFVCICLLVIASICAAQQRQAARILAETGVKGGLVVHLGCGDGKLTAALRINDSYLIHGLDRDRENIEKARDYIGGKDLYGEVSVERWSAKVLPYGDNVVNLLVAKDFDEVSTDEIMRVLCPKGVAYIKGKKMVKPRPSDIDEWTHFLHDADGNAVAKDTKVATPRHLQWQAEPKRTRDHDALASISAMTSSNGRLFYILDEGPTSLVHHPAQWRLIGRDAFNGKLLWKRDIDSWITHLHLFRSGPAQLPRLLVSVGDRVYVNLGLNEPASMLDAATGRTILTYKGSEKTEELIYYDDMLLTVTGDLNIMNAEAGKISGYWQLSVDRKPDVGKSIVSYQASTGKVLWQKTGDNLAHLVPLSLTAHKGRVFFLDSENLHCISSKTGDDLWEAPMPTKGLFLNNYAPTVVAYDDVVMCLTWNKLRSFSIADGTKLWEHRGAIGFASPGDLFAIDGLAWTIPMTSSIWNGSRLDKNGKPTTGIPIPKENFLGNGGKEIWGIDIHTGQVKRSFTRMELLPGGHHHRCYRNKATERYLICGRRGLEYIDLDGDNHINNWWVRGVCQYGIMPCNGLVYSPPHPCQCFSDIKFDGFHALAASRTTRESDTATRLFKGPAYGKLTLDTQERTAGASRQNRIWAAPVPNGNSGQWPTYRHDISRSGSASTIVPSDLEKKWTTAIGGRLSGIVVAQNKLLVSAVDRQIVYCLDAADGKELWKFFAAGPVDSPPTFCGPVAIFGSRSGHVYALRVSDGELVWRFRAAPAERRTVVRERLESVWPVHGSVLVVNGTAYFAAGHTSYLDGGIRLYGLDAVTGGAKCNTALSSDGASRDGAMPDVLVSDGKTITMRMRAFDLSLNETKRPRPATLAANTGLLEDCWGHRWNWDLGGGDTFGKLLAFDNKTAYGVQTYYTFLKHDRSMWPETHDGHLHQKYSRYVPGQFPTGTRLFARLNSGSNNSKQQKRQRRTLEANNHKWNRRTPIQYRAMVLAGDLLFGAGWQDSEKIFADDPSSDNDSVLEVISTADGRSLREYPLEAEPVFDGMAAAHSRLYMAMKDGKILCMAANTE